jgi:hypothetical protein
MPLVPPMITAFLSSYRSMFSLLATFDRLATFKLFGLLFNTMAARTTTELRNRLLIFGRRDHFAANGAPSGHRAQG